MWRFHWFVLIGVLRRCLVPETITRCDAETGPSLFQSRSLDDSKSFGAAAISFKRSH
jgi:hypothetical protein